MDKSLTKDPLTFLEERFALPEQDIKTYSSLALAYIGDAVYEVIVRTMIVKEGNAPVNRMHKKASRLVRAQAQAEMMHTLKGMLTEEEARVYKRGRNAKSFTKAKNASTADYRNATGFEAVVGYLYLQKEFSRLTELVRAGIDAFMEQIKED
jgi:ribonuclease-3 family protein